ncbi:MAG: hypothetical protein ACRD6X_17705 [Pyrinomonadaceae bacterium]
MTSLAISKSISAALLVLICAILVSPSFAQEQDVIPPDAAPPPIKALSKIEKDSLMAAKNVKDRTRLTLELMDARLKVAEAYLTQEQLEMVFRELGGFHALVINVLDYLSSSDTDNKKVISNFKRFEIGLRGFTRRLELIRREMPPQREYYVRLLLREMRAARAKAVEPLFGELNGNNL